MKKLNFFIDYQRLPADKDLFYYCPHCGQFLFRCADKPFISHKVERTQCLCGHMLHFKCTPMRTTFYYRENYQNFYRYYQIIVIRSLIFFIDISYIR